MITASTLLPASLAAVLSVAPGPLAAPGGAGGAADLADLDFLAGSWTADYEGSTLEEHWLPASGGSMAGVLRWTRGGATVMTEHFVLSQEGDGITLLLRHFGPGLEPWESEADGPTTFTLDGLENDRAVFANVETAFPLRLIYHRPAPGTLVARLEGDPTDGDRAMEFTFRSTTMTTSTSTSTETLTPVGQSMGYNGGLTIAFNVKDLDASLSWYQDNLGFKVAYRLDDMGWGELSTGVDQVFVGLSQVESPKIGGPTPTFGVQDIDKARSLLEEKGVRFDGPTQEIPGMVKLATFFDPDGNSLMLFQTLAQGSP